MRYILFLLLISGCVATTTTKVTPVPKTEYLKEVSPYITIAWEGYVTHCRCISQGVDGGANKYVIVCDTLTPNETRKMLLKR